MNTGKQINAMVLVLFLLVIVSAVYTIWDPFRSDVAGEDQLDMTAERGADLFALNCRICHGDQGEGGGPGGRLDAALPLNTDEFRGISGGAFSEDELARAFRFVSNTITCGRVGSPMPTWGESQGGTLNEEQIRQLAVLITGGDPALSEYNEEGFWDLAQEHADEIDWEATGHATVQQPAGTLGAEENELVVSNADAFNVGQYVRIGEERLRVQPWRLEVVRGVEGTEAAEHASTTPIVRAEVVEGEPPETGQTLSVDVAEDDTVLEVSGVQGIDVGDTLELEDELVRVVDITTGLPTTGQTLAEPIGRTPERFLVSGGEGIEIGTIIRLDGELMRVTAIRDDGDPEIALDQDASATAARISVGDATFFRPEYVVRIGDEHLRVIDAVETGQSLRDAVGRAETTLTVSGSEGLEEGMLIRMGAELLRVTRVEPATVEVERGVADAEGSETQAASHAAAAPILTPDAAEGEEAETGQSLLEPAEADDTVLVVTGTAGIVEEETYQLGDELVEVVAGGIQGARLQVERGVNGTSAAEHSARIDIFQGNLLAVERGVEGTEAAAHDQGDPIFLTELEVERAVGPDGRLEDHSKGAELFLGHRLIVDRGVKDTEPADHENGAKVFDFPLPPDPQINLGPACGLVREEAPATVGPTPTLPAGAQQIAVSLTEYAVAPEPASASADGIVFQVNNDGDLFHNFRVIQTDLPPDGLPVSAGQVEEEAVDVVATVEDFGPDEGRTTQTTLDPGNYVLICNVSGHYDLGMFVGFEVTPP